MEQKYSVLSECGDFTKGECTNSKLCIYKSLYIKDIGVLGQGALVFFNFFEKIFIFFLHGG